VSRPEEDRDLTELDFPALGHVARGAQHHEGEPLLVLLHLGSQMKPAGVLDGELVQAEDVLDGGELLG